MPGWVPTRPDPGYVWMALFMFFGIGLVFTIKGIEAHSISGTCIGGAFLFGGVYYTIRWFMARGDNRED
jgi:hypothetical protein